MGRLKQEYELNQIEKRNSTKRSQKQEFKPPDHGCTDIICTIIFLIFIVLFVAVSIFAYLNGNPLDILLPHDSMGNVCGKDKGYENKKNLLFFDITQCLKASVKLSCPTKQICVAACPNETLYEKFANDREKLKDYCDNSSKPECPTYVIKSNAIFGRCLPSSDITSDILNSLNIETSNGTLSLTNLNSSLNSIEELAKVKEVFLKIYEDFSTSYPYILIALGVGFVISLLWLTLLRCIIKPLVYTSILAVFGLLAFGTYFCVDRYLDLKKTKNETTKFEIKFDIDYYTDLKETWLAFSIILGVILLILLLIMLFLFKRIAFACSVIKEVSKAVISLPASFIWPVIPFLFFLGVVVYCCSVALFLASSGVKIYKIVDISNKTQIISTNTNFDTTIVYYSTTDENTITESLTSAINAIKNSPIRQIDLMMRDSAVTYKEGDYCDPVEFKKLKDQGDAGLINLECYYYKFGYDPNIKISSSAAVKNTYKSVVEFLNDDYYKYIPHVFVLFMFFWLMAFVAGLNQMTIAGSFGIWYWQNKSKSLPIFTLFKSFTRAFFLHFGTIAFGSLLIAIIKLIRVLLDVASSKLKSKSDVSKVAKFMLSCCKCCFWCLEKIVKFLNRYAFVITAVYSLNFCRASAKAFKLISANVLRIAVTDRIANFILFLSNLAITALIGVLSFYFFAKRFPSEKVNNLMPELNFYLVPLIVVIIGTYVITKICFDVFALGIDSILICVLIDLDENDGSKEKPYFMSNSLAKLLKVKNRHT